MIIDKKNKKKKTQLNSDEDSTQLLDLSCISFANLMQFFMQISELTETIDNDIDNECANLVNISASGEAIKK